MGHPIQQDGLTSGPDGANLHHVPLDEVLERALTCLREGDGPGAEAALTAATRTPEDVRVLHLRAVAAHLRRDDTAAERLVAEAVSVATDPMVLASLHNDLGNMRLEAGDPVAAVAAYESSLAVHPTDAPTWVNLATALRLAGDPARAGDAGLRALELDRQSPLGRAAVTAAVLALTADGAETRALELVRRWVRVDPDHPGARHRLAALGGLPQPDRAPDDYVETLFDATAEAFDPHLAGLGYRAPELVADRIAAILGRPAGELDVADLGCGTGLVGALVRPWARTLAGCDLSLNMLRLAQARGCYDVLQRAELGAFLRAEPTAYDLVVGADTLCYLGDLGPTTTAAARALRPGGVLVVTVERLVDAVGDWRLTSSGRYAHGEEYLRSVCVAAGLVDVEVTRVHLRLEAGVPVEGLLWSARRPVTGSGPTGAQERLAETPGQGATTARAEGRMGG
ncbi:methyltransferase domain-containing protein [Terracoccus sp. 273MFTsu3.1]|uniref:methyltransferase domain-containing protein n=1 Tax=Terracoccus sp. 273MFTsu3.1 TaxID=1172188 RepID=UPI00039DD3E6|nr:methyltransferase domain-containing protein [Terracoccus sp. 273MFTsu3.1]